MSQKEKRLVLLISILASFVAFLDGSIINVALPSISEDLGGGLAVQQWIVDAYLITLGALILVAGSLSDLFGRRKILIFGLLGFGLTSLMCAVAPSSSFLIVSRALQGVAGALLVPSSLAIIISTFKGVEQGKAIGTWTAWTGIAFVVGPLLGGSLVDIGSWRYIFAINVLPIVVTLYLLSKLELEEILPKKPQIDYVGAVLCTIGLAAPVYALIEQPRNGWGSLAFIIPMAIGACAVVAFLYIERSVSHPMLPLSLFKIRNFLFGNLATVAIYGGLSVGTFLIAIFLQQIANYSATQAGLSLLPITIIMFLLSSRFGALSSKYGPRIFMTIGPLLSGLGTLWFLRMDSSLSYFKDVLPGVIIFGIGLSITVAPLTAAVLGSIRSEQAGIGSAVNNAISRIAGLVAIASIGIIVGANITTQGFHRAIWAMALSLMIGGVISFLGIRNQKSTAI